MAKIVYTDDLPPLDQLDENTKLYIYNGLDCTITHEVDNVLTPMVESRPNAKLIYNFERALQAPTLEMECRGTKIDMGERSKVIAKLEIDAQRLTDWLNEIGLATWEKPFILPGKKIPSPQALKSFFYSYMNLPVQLKLDKTTGQRKPTTDREALEKLELYFYARPVIATILALRDVYKKLGTLRTAIDDDGRWRSSFNITGTNTGRMSSNSNALGSGANFQNVTDKLRRIFVADKGKKMAYIDLEQAESRLVGFLAFLCTGRTTYLDACEGGDLHTTVCRMVWRNLPWTGDLDKDKEEVAGQLFYRTYTYRDMSKRGGHGTNYYGTPFTMARHLKVKTSVMQDFQEAYFDAFPEIPLWHKWTAHELQTKRRLITPMGRERIFFGRVGDDATLRKGIAFVPQSSIADFMDLALLRIWKLARAYPIELMAQIHDAVLLQYPEELEDQIIPLILACMQVEIPGPGRNLIIPSEAQVGWNWGHYTDKKAVEKAKAKGKVIPLNLDGMKKWKSHDERKREYPVNSGLKWMCA